MQGLHHLITDAGDPGVQSSGGEYRCGSPGGQGHIFNRCARQGEEHQALTAQPNLIED